MWRNTCRYVKNKEEEYYRHLDKGKEFIIDVGDISESKSSLFDISSASI